MLLRLRSGLGGLGGRLGEEKGSVGNREGVLSIFGPGARWNVKFASLKNTWFILLLWMLIVGEENAEGRLEERASKERAVRNITILLEDSL